MVLLFLTFITSIHSVSGMDNDSYTPESSNEKLVDLEGYTKQKLDCDDFDSNVNMIAYDQTNEEKSGVKILSKESEEKLDEYNKLKRKQHKSIPACEFCQRKSTKYKKGTISGISLCEACYCYEYRHGYLVLRDTSKRKRSGKHKSHILVCDFCQEESTKYKTSKISDQILCEACYFYESRHGDLVPLDQRKYYRKHKDNILACEYCQKESFRYTTGKTSGKSLCNPCYQYEYKHGHLIPPDERENPRKYIFVCEFCQKESMQYKSGKISDKSLCEECYQYKSIHDNLIPSDKRNKSKKHKAITKNRRKN